MTPKERIIFCKFLFDECQTLIECMQLAGIGVSSEVAMTAQIISFSIAFYL